MHSTHHKGLIGELEFTSRLTKLGYTVLRPINPNSSYDLVIEENGQFTKIQVKYCTPHKGRIRVELDRPKRKTKSYQKRSVDAMGIYDALHEKFYLIPISKVENKTEFWLRIEKPKNFQTKNINLAQQFELKSGV